MSATTLDARESRGEWTSTLHRSRAVVEAHLRQVAPHVDVGDLDRFLPLREETGLDATARAELLRCIEQETGVALRADLLDDDASIDDVAHALAVSLFVRRWQVTITFDAQEGFGTRATAVLQAGLDEMVATGDARKHPADPYVVDVGHEVAAARALAELARNLLEVATTRISTWDDDALPVAS